MSLGRNDPERQGRFGFLHDLLQDSRRGHEITCQPSTERNRPSPMESKTPRRPLSQGVVAAFEILSDGSRRAAYDQELQESGWAQYHQLWPEGNEYGVKSD